MQEEKSVEKWPDPVLSSSDDNSFAILKLWEVLRYELLMGGKIRFCRTCFSFLLEGDPNSEHPPLDTVSAKQYFAQSGITSLAQFSSFMKNLWSMSGSSQKNLQSLISAKHSPSTDICSGLIMEGSSPAHAAKAKMESALLKMTELARRTEQMVNEQQELLRANERLLHEFDSLKASNAKDFSQIAELARKIENICHSEECWQRRIERKPC